MSLEEDHKTKGSCHMKYVLITGGTSGIGFELARLFAKNDYGVIIVGSSEEKLLQSKQVLESEFSTKIQIYRQNLSEIGAALALYQKIKTAQLEIDILVNNAGVGLVGPTEQIELAHDENMMVLNVINLVEICKLFIKDMYLAGRGKILNVASTGAFQPGPYTSTYFASKAFVLSYSRAIRYEAQEKGVQVCVLCPGATKTNFFHREGTETPLNAMPADKVAQYTYEQFMKNKEVIVPGVINQMIRAIPIKIKMRIVANMKGK